MEITVNEFKHIPGENDAEYIALLEEYLKRQRQLTVKAIAKLKSDNRSGTVTRWRHSDVQTDSRGCSFPLVECEECGYQTYAISNIVRDAAYCPCCGLKIVK